MKKLIFILFLFLSPGVLAQQNPYASAEFWRNDCYTKDDVIAYWDFFDTFSTGNYISDIGDFEQGFSIHAQCGFCPNEISCSCEGTSKLYEESSILLKGDKSIKFEIDALGSDVYISTPVQNLSNNTAYQFSFWVKGTDGTEDLSFQIQGRPPPYGATAKIFYNITTDTWGGAVSISITNTPSVWTKYSYYVINNSGSELRDVILLIRRTNPSQVFYVDNIESVGLRSIGPKSNNGIVLTPNVVSDPIFNKNKDLFDRNIGTKFDGVNDVISYADPNSLFNPNSNSYNFSIGLNIKTNSNTANQIYLAKGNFASRSYFAYYTGANNSCYISNDGSGNAGSISALQKAASLELLYSYICTYQYRGNNNSLFYMYQGNESTTGTTAARGPIFNNIVDGLGIGNYESGMGVFSGININKLTFWNKYLSQKESIQYNNPWYPKGFSISLCLSTSPPATCGSNKCRDSTVARCEPELTGAKRAFGDKVQLIPYNSFETQIGDDSNPTYTGWTITNTPGDGTARVITNRIDNFHGNISPRLITTGTTSKSEIKSSCLTTGIGGNIYSYLKYKISKGQDNLNLKIHPFNSVDCTIDPLLESLFTEKIDSEWKEVRGLYNSWPVGTNSYQLSVSTSGKSDITIDTVDLKQQIFRTPWISNNTAGPVTYLFEDNRLTNPTSEYNGTNYNYQNGFCIGMWIFNPWPLDSGLTHVFWVIPGTAVNNNRSQVSKTVGSNRLDYSVYDLAGVIRTISITPDSTSWQKESWKYVETCTSNTGTIKARHYETKNSTWYNWPNLSGAGTAIQDNQSGLFYIRGMGSTDSLEGYYHGFWIGPYSLTWPMYGFNKKPIRRPY
jgi:hypothetical protein